ncbi:50S ribosomal subunit protein L17 [Candidatus Hodgkinia cicadicola]|nr:50S ribosomal subunit protein L17 [Candidatus Hodgkinia cicadicola]
MCRALLCDQVVVGFVYAISACKIVHVHASALKIKTNLEAFISLARRNDNRSRSIRLVRAKLRRGSESAARAPSAAKLHGEINSGFAKTRQTPRWWRMLPSVC